MRAKKQEEYYKIIKYCEQNKDLNTVTKNSSDQETITIEESEKATSVLKNGRTRVQRNSTISLLKKEPTN